MPNDTSNDNHSPPSTYELLTQLTTGPTTREVAANTLRLALKEQYPTLNIDPDLAIVVTPRWRVVDGIVEPAPAHTESLTSVLAHQALSNERVAYIDGEHFLTQQPHAAVPIHLAVKIDAIGRLINELSELLFTAFQEQQLDFWNTSNGGGGPRWRTFSNTLKKVWNITEQQGLGEHECAMARTVFHEPDRAKRSVKDPYKSHAYLVDVDILKDDLSTHVSFLDITVLVGEHENRQIILTYSLVTGYEVFESLEQFGATLPARLSTPERDSTLHWRLYEPDGNFFDTLACTLIELQIYAIGSYGKFASNEPIEEQASLHTAARIMPSIEDLSDHQLSNIRDIHQQLPNWLAAASDADAAAYSRHMINLAQLHTHYHGETFQDGIAPIREYARAQLQSRFLARKNGANLNLDNIVIVIESPVLWGTLLVPGAKDTTRRSLIDLALDNLTGLPTGVTTVRYNGNGSDVPAWLTYSYLKGVIEDIDIGEHYPALIKQKLLDDTAQSNHRQQLYTSHLRIQLPLLALQMKIRQQGGIDELGYRYIGAAMQADEHDRSVDGQLIVIRPLAFVPTLRPGHQQDVVANMYVIGPRAPDAGPCLLYRPLLEPALLQYPSRQNLLYAIKHNRALRESVLAWLPEAESFNYAQYVFPDTWPSPWSAVRVLIEPATVLYMSGPVTLTNEEVGNDALATLFKANATAMVELAKRQSVSNVQKRWATFRHAGWQIFNAALPFMGRTLGIAAWIWQIMDDLQTAEEAANTRDSQVSWTALVDIFLNVGMALALHVAVRHSQPREGVDAIKLKVGTETTPSETAEKPSMPAQKYIAVQHEKFPDAQLPAEHQSVLHISGALARDRSSLATTLDSFKVTRPANLGEQNKTPGTYLHLYPLADKWYAPVGARWFEVKADANDYVIIIDPKTPSRTGPVLIGNLAGQWFVDTRLRLRGAGLRNRRRAVKVDQLKRIPKLEEQLNAFNSDSQSKQLAVLESRPALDATPGPSTDLKRSQFISKVDTRLEEYEEAISNLMSLNTINSVPDYQRNMSGYLEKQVLLTHFAIEQQSLMYRASLEAVSPVLDAITGIDHQNQTRGAQSLSTLNLQMIKRLEYINAHLRKLRDLGGHGAQIARDTLARLPSFTLLELKSLEITLARYLCITEQESPAPAIVRERLDQIVDAAELSAESFREILGQGIGTTVDERIDILNSLVDQFTSIDQRLLDLHADHPEHLLKTPLESLLRQVSEFKQRAVQDLAQLLRDNKPQEPKPGSSKAPPAPRRKIIKTRYNGVVMGEPRQSDASLVDIKAAMTGKVIATFHEKTPGVWVKRQKPVASPPAPARVDLSTSINAGQTLLDGNPAEILKYQGYSKKPWYEPQDIQDLFNNYAKDLEDASNTIEEALTQLNLTESDHLSAATTKRKLAEAAKRCYQQGRETYIDMLKRQPPVAARVEWLHGQGLIKIAKSRSRVRLKAPNDFLDEYEIRDNKTGAVLWYAHFHYNSATAPRPGFFKGHLKTREQQRLGGAHQRTGPNDWDVIDIHRRGISERLAQALFFSV
ncbi:dermonecrotic toxin domain-containing protein [Pseudomonas fluorescens]